MARLLRRPLLLLPLPLPPSAARTYIADMRYAAFKESLLRVLRTEITYETDTRPPRPPPPTFASFSVEERPGERWVRLRRQHAAASEAIKVDATMFDGAVPVPVKESPSASDVGTDARLHISLIVEVSKGESADHVLNFVCSAWPDALDIEKVYPASRGMLPIKPYMGPDFREMDDELQKAAREYLEERGVNEELAEFLHEYMANKERLELVRWLKKVESRVKK